ncbi:uncharacterized protein [Polyergus mexicanus]|uniref:uncharacterized protein isoform X2 n=1 Tax=Polyergus mexicanus TaxID=615972 RepID=UPI0038B57DE0
MYSRQCVIFLLFILVHADEFMLDDVPCIYKFKQKCHGDIDNYNIIKYHPSVINYCTAEDVPDNINFYVKRDENRWNLSVSLKIEFAPPKKECGLEVALLVNPLIKNERECKEYKFKEMDGINSNVHTIKRALCILRNTNQSVKYNDNSTVSLCEDNIKLWFQHIFTGCYAVRFYIGRQKHAIKDYNKFVNTTYQRTEVTEPQFICKYDSNYNIDQRKFLDIVKKLKYKIEYIYIYIYYRHEITNFTLDASLPIDTGLLLEVALISPLKNSEQGCVWNGEPLKSTWTINLETLENHCNVKLMHTGSGEYMKIVQCNFQIQTTPTARYCFIFNIFDDRCYKNTIWKPPHANTMPCTWVKRCMNASLYHKSGEMIKSDKLLTANLHLLLPIIVIVLIVSGIIGTLCFWHLCIRKKKITLYVNPQHDDFLNSACFRSTDLSIVDNNDNEKEIDHDNFSSDDIVLLYTKNSISFMALMKDFRETLAKMCSCSVYDWYDEAEWNNVAKIGPVSWFTKLLNGKCRAIWIDTPTIRSIVTSRENDSSLNKVGKYYEIGGDFRDVAFPVVLELAKRNTNDAVHQYRRHFVVRFEGLESTANVNDPFLDLSPHARYRMPQHLAQLCLDLSMIKPLISKYQLKTKENLLQQHLRLVKMESIM